MALFPLSDVHKKYVRAETLVGIGFNGILSVLFAWVPFHTVAVMPLWGEKGMALDFIPTVFMITLVQTIIITVITRNRVKAGRIAPLPQARAEYPILRMLPHNVFLRALTLAFLLSLILVPLSIGALWVLGFEEIPFIPFVAFKVVYGVAVGMLSAPLSLLAALSDKVGSSKN